MISKTIKDSGLFVFWIELHELNAEYILNEKAEIVGLSVYPKRELTEVTDAMRRSIRKGAQYQMNYNNCKTAANTLMAARLSAQISLKTQTVTVQVQ